MSFLYVVYLVTFYVLNLAMSTVRDDFVKNKKSLETLYVLIGGVFMTAAGVVVLASTFVPKGSWAFNPAGDNDLEDEFKIQDLEMKQESEGVSPSISPASSNSLL
jgi:hypothetical protein